MAHNGATSELGPAMPAARSATAEEVNAPARLTAVRPAEESLPWEGYRVAAIVPCHNEAGAVAKVVKDLHEHVPGIEVYVYDNCSTDSTADEAREAGAIVRHELLKGKGNVVRRAFADIDADVYLMVDGDDTYDAASAPELIRTLIEGRFDHVLGVREQVEPGSSAYRPNHELGNRVLNSVVRVAFGSNVGDMLSGYRAFSRRFVKSFPAISREFEIETELTVHTLSLRTPTMSVPVGFRERAAGTESKLRTYRDGTRILALILNLVRHERPDRLLRSDRAAQPGAVGGARHPGARHLRRVRHGAAAAHADVLHRAGAGRLPGDDRRADPRRHAQDPPRAQPAGLPAARLPRRLLTRGSGGLDRLDHRASLG